MFNNIRKNQVIATIVILIVFIILAATTVWFLTSESRTNQGLNTNSSSTTMEQIKLPEPKRESQTSLEEAMVSRRSVREYKEEPLTLEQISQLMWAAQGITESETGKRAAPSAGALYPVEIYVAIDKAKKLEPGVYRYLPDKHSLKKILEERVNQELSEAALDQEYIEKAPVNLVITGDPSVIAAKYGEKGEKYTLMETGHVAQNVYLQAESLSLGTVSVGAFQKDKIKEILGISSKHIPYYIMPVGKKKD